MPWLLYTAIYYVVCIVYSVYKANHNIEIVVAVRFAIESKLTIIIIGTIIYIAAANYRNKGIHLKFVISYSSLFIPLDSVIIHLVQTAHVNSFCWS